MKSGQGCLSLKRTRLASGVSTAATRSFSALFAAPLYLSYENFTSSAVTGSPL